MKNKNHFKPVLGKKSGILKFPKFTDLQTELFELFKVKPNDMTSLESHLQYGTKIFFANATFFTSHPS